MEFLIVVGIISLIFGVLLLFFPQRLRNLSTQTEKAINKLCISIDEKVYKLRIGTGISLILVSVLSFFVIYYLIRKSA